MVLCFQYTIWCSFYSVFLISFTFSRVCACAYMSVRSCRAANVLHEGTKKTNKGVSGFWALIFLILSFWQQKITKSCDFFPQFIRHGCCRYFFLLISIVVRLLFCFGMLFYVFPVLFLLSCYCYAWKGKEWEAEEKWGKLKYNKREERKKRKSKSSSI